MPERKFKRISFIQIITFILFTLSFGLGTACHQVDHCVTGDIECNSLSILAFATIPPTAGTVTALYPGASQINDYIANDGSTFLNATGAACSLVGNGWGTCLHAGLMRTADLGGATGCGNFTISDSLDALQWYCDDSTGVARAVSAGLKPEVPLSTVIDFDSGTFKPMSVIVSTGLLSSTSAAQTFWTNPLIIDNDGIAAATAVSGNIYLITQDPNNIYVIDTDRVGLIIKPGVVVQGTGAGAENIIDVNTANHVWLEGQVNMVGDTNAFRLNASSFSVLRNVAAYNCTAGTNVFLLTGTSRSNYLGDVRVADPVNCVGIQIDSTSNYNVLERIIISNGGSNLIRTQTSAVRNTFVDLTSFTAGANTFANIGVNDTAILNASFIAAGRGISANSTGNNMLVMNTATINHTFDGISYNSTPSNNRFINIMSAYSTADGIDLNTSSNNTFSGNLKVFSNTTANCTVTGGTAPGLITTTCTDSGSDGSSTYTGQTSTAILSTNSNPGVP